MTQINPQVLAWQPLSDKGNLRGYAVVQVGPAIFEDVRLVQQPGQKAFVGPPQKCWTDDYKKKHYAPLVHWPKEWSEAILRKVLDAQRDYPDGLSEQSQRRGVRG